MCLRASYDIVVKMLAEVQSSEGFSGAQGSVPNVAKPPGR